MESLHWFCFVVFCLIEKKQLEAMVQEVFLYLTKLEGGNGIWVWLKILGVPSPFFPILGT